MIYQGNKHLNNLLVKLYQLIIVMLSLVVLSGVVGAMWHLIA